MAAPPFSIEAFLISTLNPQLSAPVTVEPEPDFTAPLIVIERVGGTYDGFRIHDATVDVDVFAVNREGAETLAWDACDAILSLAGVTHRGIVVARVEVESAPRAIAYLNSNLRRFSSTYRLVFHAA